MGAEAFVDFTNVTSTVEEVRKIADGVGAHGVFVTAPQGYKDAVSYIGRRVGATIMCVGIPPASTVTVGADPLLFAATNLHIAGTMTDSRKDTDEARPLSRLPDSIEQLRKGLVPERIVIDFISE